MTIKLNDYSLCESCQRHVMLRALISLSLMIPRRTVSLFSFLLSSKPATVMRTICPGKRTHSTTKHVPQGHNVGPNVSSHACHCYAHHVSR